MPTVSHENSMAYDPSVIETLCLYPIQRKIMQFFLTVINAALLGALALATIAGFFNAFAG